MTPHLQSPSLHKESVCEYAQCVGVTSQQELKLAAQLHSVSPRNVRHTTGMRSAFLQYGEEQVFSFHATCMLPSQHWLQGWDEELWACGLLRHAWGGSRHTAEGGKCRDGIAWQHSTLVLVAGGGGGGV